ncbi:hypothetical protein F8B43_1930 [Methylorubrum populi]|uniref:Uncharacterized protein n=1 Tax=Methylorubrum populi TaxID=223967 RepID=A0A833N378_9HYPH|nr:hypothetical protein F8B43_1930 [Methylorubrum populi]
MGRFGVFGSRSAGAGCCDSSLCPPDPRGHLVPGIGMHYLVCQPCRQAK